MPQLSRAVTSSTMPFVPFLIRLLPAPGQTKTPALLPGLKMASTF
jgi:hypothetical protein